MQNPLSGSITQIFTQGDAGAGGAKFIALI
jgi:hypothetical protein